jgi:NADH-quinone oxidoreductase subunit L
VPGKLFGQPTWNLIEGFMHPILLPLGGGEHAAAAHGEAAAGGGEAAHGAHAVSLGVEWGLVFLSLAVAGFGIWLAWKFYSGAEAGVRPRRIAERHPFAYQAVLNKYWVDELYAAAVLRPLHRLAQFCWKVVDVWVIDGTVNFAAFVTELTGTFLRFLQTGNVRNYALSVALGVLALALMLW